MNDLSEAKKFIVLEIADSKNENVKSDNTNKIKYHLTDNPIEEFKTIESLLENVLKHKERKRHPFTITLNLESERGSAQFR